MHLGSRTRSAVKASIPIPEVDLAVEAGLHPEAEEDLEEQLQLPGMVVVRQWQLLELSGPRRGGLQEVCFFGITFRPHLLTKRQHLQEALMVDALPRGSQEVMEGGLQDGRRKDRELSTRMMEVEQLMALEIAHQPGRQVRRLLRRAYRTGLLPAPRPLGTVEAIRGVPKPQPTNPSSTSQTIAGRTNLRRMAGAQTLTMRLHQARTRLLLLLLL
jgi:hypothetical protein